MANLFNGYVFGATEQVTSEKLGYIVDRATISNIVAADISANAVIDAKINDVSGAKFTNLSTIPSGAGVIPAVNLTSVVQKGANSDITSLTGLTGDVYNVPWTDYSSISTIFGWGSFSTKIFNYKKIGRLVFINIEFAGGSDSSVITFTVPFSSASRSVFALGVTSNNGAIEAAGHGIIDISSTTVTLYRYNETTFTAFGTKIASGSFFYEATS